MTSDIPSFEEALEKFRDFLQSSGHPTDLIWAFREDVLFPSHAKCVVVRQPLPTTNFKIAQEMYDFGRSQNIVGIHAFGKTNNVTVATVDSPKWYSEPPHGWERNLKLTIKKPIDDAQLVGRFRWWFLKRQSKSWPLHEMALFWVPSRSARQTIKNLNQERELIAQTVEVRDLNPEDNA